ncbi:MAG: carbohydrate ABC transporter permease [Chloroflexota bacterium]
MAAIVIAGLFLVPLVWVLSASLRLPGLPPPRGVEWLPDPVALGNYGELFRVLPFGRYLANSVLVVVIAVPLTLLTASMGGFAIAQLEDSVRRRLVVLSVALLLVPSTALWLTRYLVYRQLGILDTLGALVAPAVMGSSPLFVLIFYWAFRRLPAELYETARLEGAGAVAVWRRVALPWPAVGRGGRPARSALLERLPEPLLYLRSQALYSAVGLRQLQAFDSTDWPVLMASPVVLAVPAVLVFAVVQRGSRTHVPLGTHAPEAGTRAGRGPERQGRTRAPEGARPPRQSASASPG